MNFVGHIHIARRLVAHVAANRFDGVSGGDVAAGTDSFDEDRYLFGSALPDFAAIGRFQLSEAPNDTSVAAGVDLHHATDNAFHGSDWFVTHSREVRKDLEQRGINRGAARACGHVGVELLLDGHLLASHHGLRSRAQRVLSLANKVELGLTDLVSPDHRTDWSRHLRRISSWPLPDDYHRPIAVAERLHRILRGRRRLAFDEMGVAAVATTLADHGQVMTAGIADMVAAVAADVATEVVAPAAGQSR